MSWLADSRRFLFPEFCTVCHRTLGQSEHILCARCLVRLPFRSDEDPREGRLARLYWGGVPAEYAFSMLHYATDSYSHEVLMDLKYRHRPAVGVAMGRLMGRQLAGQAWWSGVEALVPVPLHWWRHFQRGYNQSFQLARGISAVTGLPIDRNILNRVRNNPTQTRLTASERADNVQGLFRARTTAYRHVVLVDDVITTGSTTQACMQALRAANPDLLISVVSLAKAQ